MSEKPIYPTNPTQGQEFTVGQTIKVWDGEKWVNKSFGNHEARLQGLEVHEASTTNPHNVTKAQVGLGDVDNVSAANLRDRSTHTGTQTLSTISDAGSAASKDVGTANGVASLDGSGKVPDSESQVPSGVIKAQLIGQGLSGNYGFFEEGFTYSVEGDIGIDADGNSWIYTGAGAPNKVVNSGTVPSSPDYEQVTFNTAENVQMTSGESVQKFTTKSRQAIEAVYKAQGYNNVFFFEDGFTYAEVNDVGVYSDGTAYQPKPSTNLPYTSGTTPNLSDVQPITVNNADGIILDGGGSVQDAITYATPEMYGLNNLDELQAQEESNLADKRFQIYAGVKLRNSRTSTEGLIDAPNFAGQTDYGNEPTGFIFHHYTDGTMIQVDNVGEDNNIVVLKNAFNPNRRPDKASNFVGNGKYVAFDYHDYDAGFSKRALFIDKDANPVWTGAKGTAKLWQNKSEDGIAAFRLQTTNSHENILDVLNGLDKSRSFTLRNDVGFTRFIFRSELTQTSGIGVEAQKGDVWLLSNDSDVSKRIKINKPIQHTSDNTQITAPTGKLVESFVPLRNRGYNFSSLPDASLYAGACAHVTDRGYRQVYSNGADWLFVSDDTVVS